jgi:hypothetical protein
MRLTFTSWLPFLFLAACEPMPPIQPSSKEQQEAKAQATAEAIRFDDNAEIENIGKRLKLTSEPGLLGYVLLFNDAGAPVYYTTVEGKITSSGKRLTKPYDYRVLCDPTRSGLAKSCSGEQVPSGSDEGTFGSSDPYVYFWTTSGAYIQWNGRYLYSDKPFRLTVEPLVVDVQ